MSCALNHDILKVKFCPSCGIKISNQTPPPVVQTPNPVSPQYVPVEPLRQQFISPVQAARSSTNTFAIIGFVTSLVCCGAPIGIVFSALALGQLKKNPNQSGKGLATAGLVISILGTIVSTIYLMVNLLGATSY